MPIKSCTRCGLKVLVDASQAASDSYLCPRCAPDAKPASSPAPRPTGGKRPSVKVTCPYCGASFSGSMPSRPAKGGCPVCQKELVLLPDGTIQAAATFNLQSWQKEKKSGSSPAAAPATARGPATDESPPEMPSTPDPLGGSTILDMGGPPGAPPAPIPSLDEPTMAIPGGVGGETMLGMGGMGEPPPPAPSIDESEIESPPQPLPDPPREDAPEFPDDLGGATILDMGPRPVELPPPDIEESSPKPDLLSEMMPGMDRPPSSESPVAPPTPPPIPEEPAVEPEPEPEPDVTEGPTIRDTEPAPVEEPTPPPVEVEADAASIESTPELPADLGGQTMLGIGGSEDMSPQVPEPAPSIEEPPPEAVPILAKDIAGSDAPPMEPADPEATEMAPGQETPKPYVYQPISRAPRKPLPPIDPPTPPPPPSAKRPLAASPSSPPPPPAAGAPVLGSDFRIAAAPPPPKPPPEPARDERRPAGPKTTAAVMPRAHHSAMKLALAWILLLIPAGAGFLLYSLQKNPGVEKVIERFKNEALPGINKIRSEIEKAAKKSAEAPPESPEK